MNGRGASGGGSRDGFIKVMQFATEGSKFLRGSPAVLRASDDLLQDGS